MRINMMPVVNGKKYYIQGNGKARKGWLQLSAAWRLYCNPSDGGAVATGIMDIEEKTYYFDGNGVLQRSCMPIVNVKKYMFKQDGSAHTGWLQLTSDWRLYCNPSDHGATMTGMNTIEKDTYYFDGNGIMTARFTREDDKTFCYDSYGKNT